MRAPNVLTVIATGVFAVYGVWEHFGVPILPEMDLPLIGSTKEILPFLATHSFWMVFLAWLSLAIAVFVPKHPRDKKADL
jgi:heme/copper-type cytochrome/quinol oxidase subunit 1